jgi:hypothetical protein
MPKKKKPAPRKKPSRKVPADVPRVKHPPRLSPSAVLARTGEELGARAQRKVGGAKHVAENRELPVVERRKAALQLAKIEFVTDREQHALRWHYEREDRPYAELWPKFKQFEAVATREFWQAEREEHWAVVHQAVQKRIQRADVEALLRDTKRFGDAFDALMEYVEPLRTADGEIERHPEFLPDGVTPHPYRGRPVIPLEMPRLDQFVPVVLKLHDKLNQQRGMISGRPAQTDDEAVKASSKHDESITMSDRVVDAFTETLLAENRRMGEFDVGDLPDVKNIGDEDIDDGFGEPQARPATSGNG